jgi:tetratricopeptide (TPR) repeat protein
MSKSKNKNKMRVKFDDLSGLARNNSLNTQTHHDESYYVRLLDQAFSKNDEPGLALAYFGYCMSLIDREKYIEASVIIRKARQILGDYFDAYFLELMVDYKKSDFTNALKAAKNYIELRKSIDPDSKPHLSNTYDSYADILWMASDAAWKKAEFKLSLEYQDQALAFEPSDHFRRIVYASNLGKEGRVDDAIGILDEGMKLYPRENAFENAKALIYGDAEKYDEAERILDRVISKNPRDVDAIINMGVISEKRGGYERAEAYFKKALSIEPSHDVATSNLKNLSDSIDSRYQKISLCMILKNEEKFLPGCLKTVKGLVDEIIVVDTGSTDRTMEIAREYGAKIYEHPWQNDFSFHRNQSIDYATGDWILIIDADEELDPSEHNLIRSAISRKNIDAITFVVYNKIQGGRTGFLNSHRMFRSGKGYHYSGIVHNQLIMDGISLSSQFKVFHHGYGLSEEQMRAKGRRTEALLLKQIEENPNNAFAHFNLAQIYRGLGDPPKSLVHAMKVIELLGPEEIDRRHVYVMALDQIGCAYVGLEQLDKAKEYFYKALEIKEDYLDPLFNLGYVYSREGNLDKSDEIFNRYLAARKIFSEHKEWIGLILNNLNSQFAVYFGLGLSQFLRNNLDKAREYFEKVVEQVGDFEAVHSLMARCYRAKGQYDKVIYHCDKAIEFGHEDHEIYLLKGEAYLNLKDSAQAVKNFDKSLQLNGEYYPSQLGLASAASLEGDYQKAIELVDVALSKSPQSAQALAAKGDLLYYAGNFTNAEENYRIQSRSNTKDPVCWNNLANCLLKQSSFASAEEYYRRALELSPEFTLAYRNLAISLLKQNKADEAILIFEKYLSINSNDFEAAITLADLLYNRKDYWGAIKRYEHFLRQSPANVNVIIRLSDCYLNMSKFNSAAMGYHSVLRLDPANLLAQSRLSELRRFLEPAVSR